MTQTLEHPQQGARPAAELTLNRETLQDLMSEDADWERGPGRDITRSCHTGCGVGSCGQNCTRKC